MFFKKEKAPQLLMKSNIITGCKPQKKDTVIRSIGNLLVKAGYVKSDYVEGMLERELTFSTNMGNGIALPHGVEKAKKEVLHSGIAVMVFPEGTDWAGDTVKVVIGIAGKGEEHLDILSQIAENLYDEEAVERLVKMNTDDIHNLLTRKDV